MADVTSAKTYGEWAMMDCNAPTWFAIIVGMSSGLLHGRDAAMYAMAELIAFVIMMQYASNTTRARLTI